MRVKGGDAGHAGIRDRLDQPAQPRADQDDIGGVKGKSQPLGRGLVARIGFERVVTRLHGKTKAGVRVGPELDVVDVAAELKTGRRRGPLFFQLPFSFGDRFFVSVAPGAYLTWS